MLCHICSSFFSCFFFCAVNKLLSASPDLLGREPYWEPATYSYPRDIQSQSSPGDLLRVLAFVVNMSPVVSVSGRKRVRPVGDSVMGSAQIAAGQPMWQVLAEPYRSLWLAWEASGSTATAGSPDQQDSVEARTAFLQSLLSAARSAKGNARSQPGDAARAVSNGAPTGSAEPVVSVREQQRRERDDEMDSRAMQEQLHSFQQSGEGRRWAACRLCL